MIVLQNTSLKDKKVYAEVNEHDVDHEVVSEWVLKRLGCITSTAQYVLLGFEELVKDEGVLTSTTLTSIRMLLSSAIDRWSEPHTVFTTGVSTVFLGANMKYGIAVYAKPPPE